MSRREYPSDYTIPSVAWLATATPRDDLQALMEAPPHEEPKPSIAGQADMRAVIADSIRHLNEQDAFIIEARYFEGLTYDELGERLGVSRQHATRLCQTAEAALQTILQKNPTIRERLGIMSYWENYAEEALVSFVPDASSDVVADIDSCVTDATRYLADDIRVGFMTHAAEIALGELIARGEYTTTEMVQLLTYKQRAYGHRNILDFGLQGVLVRMADKRSRLANLVKNENSAAEAEAHGESLIDTLRDIVGYAVIANMLLSGTFESELEPF